MKIACAVSLSNTHVIFLDHFIKSILKYNPGFNKDFLVFNNGGETDYRHDLSAHNKNHLLSLYPFKFITIPREYVATGKSDPRFWGLQCFNTPGYDRIIYFGADMICMKSMEELFSFAEKIETIAMPREKRRRDTFNSGSMIVGPSLMNWSVWKELVEFEMERSEHAHVFGHDQKIYNAYFSGRIQEVPHKFNVLVSEMNCINFSDIVILHYIYKPTVAPHQLSDEQKKIWHEYDDPDGVMSKVRC